MRLVDARAALHVVRLHREQFLQGVSRAVGFQRPDFHFAETLAAVLRLAAERLLRDERVRTDRAGVDLVRDQVAELHHVDVANDDFLIERIAGATVEQARLAVFLHPGEAVDLLRVLQIFANFRFRDSVEHRRRDLEAERFGRHAEVRFQAPGRRSYGTARLAD